MKIVFMGTPDFAETILRSLIKSRHSILSVYTQPDKKQGRKQILMPSPVKVLAQEEGIPVCQPETLYGQSAKIKEYAPDGIVVAAYGQILPEEILQLPVYGCINVHASLLPKYRGAAPIQRAILAGERETGITTMYMDKGLDTGDIALQKAISIQEDETSGELFVRLASLGADLLLETLDLIEAGQAPRKKQDEENSSYAARLTKEEAKIDFNQSAQEVHNFIRGLNPWPVAYTYCEGKKLKLFSSKVCDKNGPPGELLDEKQMIIGCREKSVYIQCVQIEGGKKMDSRDFLNGRRLRKGSRLA